MSSSKPQICCPNPSCAAPLNAFGSLVCESCQTPLTYRYLWATGPSAQRIAAGTQVAGRYYVSAPHIWLDTQPSLLPDVPANWSDEILPYLYLYPHRLHLPEVYGFCSVSEETPANSIFLLENVPLDGQGLLHPAIGDRWAKATAVRQLYWLWQMLQLWTPLLEQGVAASLLAASNIRVEGWRIRLCQLYDDAAVLSVLEKGSPDQAGSPELALSDLANLWAGWLQDAKPVLQHPLEQLCQQMQADDVELSTIALQLNQLLLEQSAQLPLRLQIAGGTDTGPQRSHNEDTCYPVTGRDTPADSLLPRLAIVCDGIGGHEGGEVASQLAVRSLKIQAQALLAEVMEQTEPVPPDLLAQQLEASVRVVNNLIAAQNDEQGREDRRRMGTTLMMALQVPQRIRTSEGVIVENGHELYLVSVGDSRAYWITPHYCHALTVDDDVAVREVRMGRSLHWEALRRPDAGSLTQAIGTRSSELLHPTVQRFILEEDGVLLLCSDGLSDNGLVEQSWSEITEAVLRGKRSLESAVGDWIALANQKNGYDNTSVVLLHCHVSSPLSGLALPSMAGSRRDSGWSPASQALLQDAATAEPVTTASAASGSSRRSQRWRILVGLLLLLLLGSGVGLVASQLDPGGFQTIRQRLLPK